MSCDRRHVILLQMACDSSAVEESMLNIFQRGRQPTFLSGWTRLVFQSVVGAIASAGPLPGSICVIESHSVYGQL